jgi:hypothetical protein
MSMRDFLLGIAASYIAAILFSRVQPYVPPFLLSKLLRLIQLPILRVHQASTNRAFAYAAAGYVDNPTIISILLFVIAIIYIIGIILHSIAETIISDITFEALMKIIIIFLLLIIACLLNYVASIMLTAIHLDKYYKWRLAIIAPHISLQEEKEINAMWALMKNRFDYEQVNQKLNSIAEVNGIVLPEPFLNALKI